MTEISLHSVIARGTDHVEAESGGQTMMMHIEKGRYFAMAETAQSIWGVLDKPKSVRAIVDAMMERFDVDRATCETDVVAFVAELAENGLVTVEPRAR